MGSDARPRWPLAGLAVQSLGRRATRTTLLAAAVAIASAVAFAGTVTTRSIEASLAVGFDRLGADLMVVADRALTNIAAALLVVEPTDTVLPADLIDRAAVAGIARAAPQRVFRTAASGFGAGESVDLVGFDPGSDFTVRPWIAERLGRPMAAGDVVLGAAREEPLGAEVALFGRPFRVWGRLGPSGVGPHERGVFLPMPELLALAPAVRERTGALPPMLDPAQVSGFLVELAPGATELAVRFALLSRLDAVKVVGGGSLATGLRQGLDALLGGTLALVGAMVLSIGATVAVLFSAIVAERRRELGLLKAIGARRGQIVGTLTLEAVIATGGGGLAGVALGALLLRLVERSLVFHMTGMGLPFLWLDRAAVAAIAAACVAASVLVGALGALVPAWRASREDPYDLLRGDG